MSPDFTPDFSRHGIMKCDKCKKVTFCHRHHLKHEKLFITVFAGTPRAKTKWYKALVKRYYEFHPYDVRYLCPDCHWFAHMAYRKVMRRKNKSTGWKAFERYTIPEAIALMKAFRKHYFAWRGR